MGAVGGSRWDRVTGQGLRRSWPERYVGPGTQGGVSPALRPRATTGLLKMYISGEGRGAAEGPQGTSPGRLSSWTSAPPHTGSPGGREKPVRRHHPKAAGPTGLGCGPAAGAPNNGPDDPDEQVGAKRQRAQWAPPPRHSSPARRSEDGRTRKQSQGQHLAESRAEVPATATRPLLSGPRSAAGDHGPGPPARTLPQTSPAPHSALAD